MKNKFYFQPVFIIPLLFVFYSCRSVNKLYQHGKYDQAVFVAVKKLGKNKLKPQTKALVTNAYTNAIAQHELRISALIQSSGIYKWESIVSEYKQAQKLSDAIMGSPEALEYVQPKDYSSAIQTATINAVAVRKEKGLYFMGFPDKINNQLAYNEFSIARSLDPENSEILDLQQQSFAVAVTNIIIAPVTETGYNRYNLFDLEKSILCKFQNDQTNRFVNYYNAYEAVQKQVRVDQVVELTVNGIEKERPQNYITEKNMQKENVLIRETVIRPDSIIREYGTVYAKYNTHKQLQNYLGRLNLRIKENVTGRYLVNKYIDAAYCFENEYASYTGDERALTEEQKKAVRSGNRNGNFNDEQMTRSITDEFIRKITDELKYRSI
jgi:hypothetical protein